MTVRTFRTSRGVLLLFALLAVPCMMAGQVKVRAVSAGFASAIISGDRFGIKASAGEPISGLTQGEVFKMGTGFWYADPEAKVPEAVELEFGLPGEIPPEFRLHQNYPNPFNPVTNILISIPRQATARIEVYDMIGRLVTILVDKELNAGTHRLTWDARDKTGRSVASGIYVYRLVAGEYSETRTMILLK